MRSSGNPADVRRARNATLLVFTINGVAFASWMARVPDVREILGLTPGQLGVLLLALSVGSLGGLPAAGWVAHRLGATATVRLGMAAALPGILLAALAVQAHLSMYAVMPALFLLGLGVGMWDVAQNLEGTIVEQALNRSIMPWFHAGFSGGTVVGALVGALLTWLEVPIGLHLAVVVALSLALGWWATGAFLPAFDESSATPGTSARGRSAWTEPRTLLIGVMVLAAGFTEGTANDWMAVAFVDGHGVSNAMGVLALAVFLSFMTAGRILGTHLLDRYGRVTVLRILFTLALIGCALVVFGTPVLAYVGAALWGVGASLGFPVGVSAASDDPAKAPMRLSVVSTIGYGSFLVGPPLIGFLGDLVGILPALLAVGAMSLVAIALVPVARPLPGNEPTNDAPAGNRR
ncbi:MAG: MFS transporter [Propioniciclava sp.]